MRNQEASSVAYRYYSDKIEKASIGELFKNAVSFELDIAYADGTISEQEFKSLSSKLQKLYNS